MCRSLLLTEVNVRHRKEFYPGYKVNRLTIIKELPPTEKDSGRKSYQYLCKCDCGNIKIISHKSILRGTKSCGCISVEKTIERNTSHGLRGYRLYEIYRHLVYRCTNKNYSDYKDYGFRGIEVCKEWLGENVFLNFEEWSLENGYSPELTLDRIDVNGNYEPQNCRWVTNVVQQRNKRNNFYITYKGETKTCAEWAEIKHINRYSLYYRLKAGWSVEKALETPIKYERVPSITSEDDERTTRNKRDYQRFITKCDNSLSETKIAKEIGISLSSLQKWKNGKCHPTTEHMHTIIKYIGVNEDYFEIV